MSEDWSEKTEAPTPYRRTEARRRGQVARSAEVPAAALCLAAVMLIHHSAPTLLGALKLLLADSLTSSQPLAPARILLLGQALTPVAAGLLLVALAANLVQTGFLFGLRKDTGVLDPIAGFARLFSQRSFVGLLMSVMKLAVVTVVAALAVRGQLATLLLLQTRSSFAQILTAASAVLYTVAIRVAAALLVLALVDYAYQRHLHERGLRMSRREIRQELRRQEGDPALKRRRRDIAQAWATSRVQRDVAAADVVIADDRFGAIALRYDARNMSAPRVLAKSQNLVSMKSIREAALEHGVPLIERPALAGAIGRSVGVGRDVPARFHAALAEVFAYAMEVRSRS